MEVMIMWNEPCQERLDRIPRLYETEGIPLKDKLVQMHFFLGGCDWFVVEYSPEERLFFGFAILNHDLANAEWGYFSLDELRALRVGPGFEVDCEIEEFWSVRPACEVDYIRLAQGWRREAGHGAVQVA